MTQLKAKAVEMIQKIPDDNMFYVMNILENLEAMSNSRDKDKNHAMIAFQDLMKIERRLPEDFDAKRELMEAREERYGCSG